MRKILYITAVLYLVPALICTSTTWAGIIASYSIPTEEIQEIKTEEGIQLPRFRQSRSAQSCYNNVYIEQRWHDLILDDFLQNQLFYSSHSNISLYKQHCCFLI